MNVLYSKNYNIDLGLLNYLHPFEGRKFEAIFEAIKMNARLNFIEPPDSVGMDVIDEFLSEMMRKMVRDRVFLLRALEVPSIPFLSFSFLDRKVLSPMRWGVAGTILGARRSIRDGGICWNLSGGYHHAMPQEMEGFCIYNDVGICYQQLLKEGLIAPSDKILIIDTDAHHGNGNAHTFMKNDRITILDVYNAGIYPTTGYSRNRVDIPVPLQPGTEGREYLSRYKAALETLGDDYRLAFVVAGTDVLTCDRLGGLGLSIDDVVEREKLTVQALRERNIPAVILGGGGYSKDSAKCVIRAISACAELVA